MGSDIHVYIIEKYKLTVIFIRILHVRVEGLKQVLILLISNN